MKLDFTFVHSTRKDRGRAVNIQLSNSRIASWSHASRRAKAKQASSSLLKPVDKDSEAAPLEPLPSCKEEDIEELHDVALWSAEQESTSICTEKDNDGGQVSSKHLPAGAGLCVNHTLTSALDPFVSLPVKVTARERSLLHFWLSRGRCMVWGTLDNPMYDPILFSAQQSLETHPIWTYTHIAMADALVSRMTNHPPSAHFHLRQSQAYKAMQELVHDNTVPVTHQIAGFKQLISLEAMLGRQKPQTQHLLAMHKLVEMHGGFAKVYSQFPTYEQTVALCFFSCFYSSTFLSADASLPSLEVLGAALAQFTITLRCINMWTRSIHHQLSSERMQTKSTEGYCAPTHTLADLQTYLDLQVNSLLARTDADDFSVAYAFYLGYNLCVSQTIHAYNPAESLSFLQHVEHVMSSSATIDIQSNGERLWRIPPACAVVMLGYVRYSLSWSTQSQDFNQEVEINTSSINTMKLLPFLSQATRMSLARKWIDCSLRVLSGRQSSCDDLFTKQEICDLMEEIQDAWYRKRQR